MNTDPTLSRKPIASYEEYIQEEKVNSTRVIAALGALLFVVYSIMDYFGLPQEALFVLYPMRISVVIILGIIFALTYKPIFQKHYNKTLMFGYLYAGFVICIGVYISKTGEYTYDLYFAAIMILMMTAFSWSYLPIKNSIFISVIFVAAYIMIKVFHHQDIKGVRFLTLMSHLFFLISVGVVAATAQFIRDNLISKNFKLQEELIITAQEKAQEAKINKELADIDSLTGIPNRRYITEALKKTLIEIERSETQLTLLFLDLNGFKIINDDYGHDAGDKILEITAKRLTQTIRKGDHLARLGGDEFLIGLKTNQRATSEFIAEVCQKLKTNISAPIAFNGNLLQVGVSIGTASSPMNGNTIESLLKVADQNMYIDKQKTKAARVSIPPALSANNKVTKLYPNQLKPVTSYNSSKHT